MLYKLIRPILFRIEPEKAHKLMIGVGNYLSDSRFRKLIELKYGFNDKRLQMNGYGINFKNPVGLAAGFDKNGELLDFLPYLGFGFAEIGSITALPSEGNQKPRISRLTEYEALINNMGLNNNGADEVYFRLKKNNFKIPVGVNIAKTNDPEIKGSRAIQDFCYTFERMYLIGDYITLNISCPNTMEGKTFEDKYALDELLSALNELESKFHRKKPVMIKISNDLCFRDLENILEVSERHGLSGYVISNTSETEIGGLSGKPIKNKSTELIRCAYRRGSPQIIGIGGIFSAEDAYEKIRAGASLIQIYTGLVYKGPGLVKRVKKGLIRLLEQDGFASLSEAVGCNTKHTI